MRNRHAPPAAIENPAEHRHRRIAIVDYDVSDNSPSGSCHLRLLEALYQQYDFTVYSCTFDNPHPDQIEWVRVPAVRRPQAARYLSFYPAASALVHHRQRRGGFDLVQAVEGYTRSCDISYVHFCHRAYLRRTASPRSAFRATSMVRRLNHQLRAAREKRAVTAPQLLVAPAEGLVHDLQREFSVPSGRIRVVPNPIELQRFRPRADFDRQSVRARLGVPPNELLVSFVALGDFERKGLPAALSALGRPEAAGIRLTVVGGGPGLVRQYERLAETLGVEGRVCFVGMQADVRPYLWSSDAFVFPSSYEVFSLAPLQAAAAGLPLLVTAEPGVAPFFEDGRHGFTITRDPASIAAALRRVAELEPAQRRELGGRARKAAEPFDVGHFVERWRSIYSELLG